MSNYMTADLTALDAVRCPCGWAKRAFAEPGNATATMHLVKVERARGRTTTSG